MLKKITFGLMLITAFTSFNQESKASTFNHDTQCSEYTKYKQSNLSSDSNADLSSMLVSSYPGIVSNYIPQGINQQDFITEVLNETDSFCRDNPNALLVDSLQKISIKVLAKRNF